MVHTVHFPFLLGMLDEAHVVWAMYCVKSGFSSNSVNDFGDVLKRMCQTDPVLSEFQMHQVAVCDQPWFISTF